MVNAGSQGSLGGDGALNPRDRSGFAGCAFSTPTASLTDATLTPPAKWPGVGLALAPGRKERPAVLEDSHMGQDVPAAGPGLVLMPAGDGCWLPRRMR